MSINKKHYFHAHIAIYISIKVNIVHIFHINIRSLITLFHRRFVYIHTFFRRKIMCGCRLATCLYDIRRASCKRRLYHNHVAPSTTISATFTSTIDKIYLWAIRAVMLVLSHPVCLYSGAAFVYRNILLGKNLHSLIRTHIRKIHVDFFAPSYYIYCILPEKM